MFTSLVDIYNSRPDLKQAFPKGLVSGSEDNKKLNNWWNQYGVKEYPNVSLVPPGDKRIQDPETLTAEAQAREVPKSEAPTKVEEPRPREVPGDPDDPSVVNFLNSINQPSDFASRKALWEQAGGEDYVGSAAQNTELKDFLRDSYSKNIFSPDSSLAVALPKVPTEEVSDTERALLNQLPPDLQNYYKVLTQYYQMILDQNLEVNPEVEITPERLQEFQDQAVKEFGEYFSGEQKTAIKDLQRNLKRSSILIRQAESDIERQFRKEFRGVGEEAAELGITRSGERLRAERELAEEATRAIGRGREELQFQAGGLALATEREVGSKALRSFLFPTLTQRRTFAPSGEVLLGGAEPIARREGGIFGRLSRQKLTAEQTRAAELEEVHRRRTLLNT